jgi:hypothetical protein
MSRNEPNQLAGRFELALGAWPHAEGVRTDDLSPLRRIDH